MATAQDGSSISLTGQGTFQADRRAGNGQVTGGGTWSTTSETGAVTGAGTYQVTSFVQFAVAPGAAAAGLTDLIAAPSTARAGLLKRYDPLLQRRYRCPRRQLPPPWASRGTGAHLWGRPRLHGVRGLLERRATRTAAQQP